MKKVIKIILKCILGIICALVLFVLVLIGWDVVVISNVDHVSGTSFTLPGVDDRNFNMQAIAWDEEAEEFIFSGYMRNNEACPVYRMPYGDAAQVPVDDSTQAPPPDNAQLPADDATQTPLAEELTRIDLLRSDGSKLVNHAGGIEVAGNYVYLAGSSDDCLYVFSRNEILNTEDGGAVKSVGTFPTAISQDDGIKPALLTVADGKLYVGEFHFPVLPWYRLRKNHHIGSTYAIMGAFAINPEKPLGLDETPCEAYCLPEMTQGVAVKDGEIFLARSFFLFPSEIASYQPVPNGSMTLLGTEVPVYSLDKKAGVRIPPFAEEIEILDGKLYISTEVCCYLPSWIYNMWDGWKCRTIDVATLER